MKKIKQFSLKATLLTIVAALTIGFTGCSDELSGDQTQGKPGYLTINVKTLKPNQSKILGTGASDDYKTIKDLNIFVFDASGNKLIQKYYGTSDLTVTTEGVVSDIQIQVSTLPANAYVVAVANFGVRMSSINTVENIESTDISTIKDFSNSGLHMTGKGVIIDDNGGYLSNVKVAPVEAKITVDWTLSEDALNYDVTGVYVVNAVSNTKLPIIRTSTHPSSWLAENILPKDFINITASGRTAASGLVEANHNYNFYYTDNTTEPLLKDEISSFTTDANGIYLNATYTPLVGGTTSYTKLHYYVGENYSDNTTPLTANTGAMVANIAANTTHQNTLVVIRVTPKNNAPDYIKLMGHKYYTYELNKGSVDINHNNATTANVTTGGQICNVTGTDEVGFSVRRKTNYALHFNLSGIGSTNPFERLKTLTVQVSADGWDDGSRNISF